MTHQPPLLEVPLPHTDRFDAYMADQLGQHPLLASLSDADAARAVERFDIVEVDAGRTLMDQGDPADALWVLLAGRCTVEVDGRAVAEVGAGRVLGELGLLTDAPRMATVRASRDSVAARLHRDALHAMVQQVPAFWRALGQCSARKVTGLASPAERGHSARTFAVIALDDSDVMSFAEQLREAVADAASVAVARSHEHGSALSRDALERAHDAVIYVLPPGEATWAGRILMQVDAVLWLARGDQPPPPFVPPLPDRLPKHLVLLQPAGVPHAQGTAAWLDLLQPRSHHHVRDGHDDDLARTARLLLRRGIGASLAGASSRGIAHLGLHSAMEQLGMPLDAVAGTSSGAVVAAGLALGWSHDRIRRLFVDLIDASRPRLRSLSLPVAALLSDRAPLSALRRAVGDVHIEDLLVPLFIPATDIRHARRVVFDRGPLWRALRATTSLPLVWSPLLHEGQVLVDGGLMSNQPLDLLLPTCGEGLVLAHDLLPPPEHNRSLLRPEPEGPPTGLRDRLRRRLQRAVGPLRLPNVALHAMTIPSYQAQAAFDAGQAPPAVRSVRPELHDYGFFEVDQAEADALIASVHTQSLTTLSSLGDPHA